MYQIYPTLLDSFVRYKNSTDYKIAEDAFTELINKINRVEEVKPPIVSKGILFKKVVDMEEQQFLNTTAFTGTVAGFTEDEMKIVNKFRERLQESLKEVFTEAILQTKYGDVRLYGYVDNLLMDCGFDVKLCERYDLLKYFSSQQRLVYPYCLSKSGANISRFEFWATDLKEIFVETYNWNPQRDIPILVQTVEEFIEFLEKNREKVTDKKIFQFVNERPKLTTEIPIEFL